MKKRILYLSIKIFVSFSILTYLFIRIEIKNIFYQLSNLSAGIIAIFVGIFFLNIIIQTINYLILLGALNEKKGFLTIFKPVILTSLLSNIIPGKMGEFAMAYFLSKKNVSLGIGLIYISEGFYEKIKKREW